MKEKIANLLNSAKKQIIEEEPFESEKDEKVDAKSKQVE